MTTYIIRAHDGEIDAKAFSCGQSALDDYIRRYALQDVKRDLARVFVASPADDLACLAGFFTLSAGSVNCSELPEKLAHKLPRYPVPVALIGRLAVAIKPFKANVWAQSCCSNSHFGVLTMKSTKNTKEKRQKLHVLRALHG